MAKRKSAALFEVIHSDRRFPQRHGWSLGASKWFSRRRKAAAAEDAAPAARESSPSTPWRMWSWRPPFHKLGLQLDPDRQTVAFQMSYTTALVTGFALLVVLALAFVIGKHSASRALPALADVTTEDLRNGPIHTEVLDVGTGGPQVAMASGPAPTPLGNARPGGQTARPASWTEPKPPTTYRETNGVRTNGLYYVVVQSYPPDERQLAEEAMQLLNKNGVPCSVETKTAFAPRWFSVVGYNGYASVKNNPDYDHYVSTIQEIGERFGQGVKFKKFQPMAFKWREVKTGDQASR